VVIAIVDYFWL